MNTFCNIPVGTVYRDGGSIWRKRSSRTTQLLSYGSGLCGPHMWFYAELNGRVDILLPSVG